MFLWQSSKWRGSNLFMLLIFEGILSNKAIWNKFEKMFEPCHPQISSKISTNLVTLELKQISNFVISNFYYEIDSFLDFQRNGIFGGKKYHSRRSGSQKRAAHGYVHKWRNTDWFVPVHNILYLNSNEFEGRTTLRRHHHTSNFDTKC